MRRHAHAATAGSTQHEAGGLVSHVRGALAIRGGSGDVKGTSAPAARRLAFPMSLLAFALVAAALTVSPASATVYIPEGPFGSAAQPTVGTPLGLAVDQSTGDLLAADQNPAVIKRYNPDGTPDNFSALGTNVIDGEGPGDETPQGSLAGLGSSNEMQVAVDNSGGVTDGNIYVALSGVKVVDVFASTGAYLGQLTGDGTDPFGEPCGVAVDSSGVVYVGDYITGIQKFVPTANPPVNSDHVATFPVSTVCAVAAGAGPSAGSLFATKYYGEVLKVDAGTGLPQFTIEGNESVTVYTDPETGNVFVATGNAIREYNASGGSAKLISTIPTSNETKGVAVGATSGDVYLSENQTSTLKVFGLPPVHTSGATNVAATSATLRGRITPNGDAVEECYFEYGLAAPAYGQSVPCVETPASIGTGSNPVSVHADLSGLSGDTTYHFRLVMKNANGTTFGDDSAFTTLSLPAIKDTWADSVVVSEATLKAKINPKDSPTTYHVEYGLTPSYGNSTSELSLAGDDTDHTATAFLDDLEADTTYHYRFVATSALGSAESADRSFTTFAPFVLDTSCPNQAFRTGPSASLPDCRAYEMVSPVDKDGSDISTKATSPDNLWAALNQSAASGDKFTFSAHHAFAGNEGSFHSSQYMSTRGKDGWTTDGISPPHAARYSEYLSILFETEYKFFSRDLSVGYLTYNDKFRTLAGDAPLEVPNVYRRDFGAAGGYQALITEETGLGPHGNGAPFPEPQAISSDGEHVAFLMGVAPLTPDANAGTNLQTYLWSNGELHLVSVLPNGVASTKNTEAGSNHPFAGASATRYGSVEHAISEDGSRVFWTQTLSSGPLSAETLFLRLNAQAEQSSSGACDEPGKACTIQVSEGTSPSRFLTANPSGSKALYSESGKLYEFDVATETRTLIAGELLGGHILGASEDLSRIYFASRESLAPGAVAGARNLYAYDEGNFTFIGSLTAGDVQAGVSPLAGFPSTRVSRITPDGRHVAFMSSASLPTTNFPSGFDNADVNTGEALAEVYIYDSDANELTCASCNPSGARSAGRRIELGPTRDPKDPRSAAWITPWNMQYYAQRALSGDGSRLFFNAFDALLPQDTNGKVDVYQWEAEGSGSCEETGGCISLISSGKSTENSEFFDASPSGDDVFIQTESRLLPQDPGLIDVYDARVGGGFPQQAGTAPCEGEACQSPSLAPNDATPASASFRGAGDPPPKKARSRCRRQRSHASRNGKRHAKKKRAKACKRTGRRAAR